MSYTEHAACKSNTRLFFGPDRESAASRDHRERLAKAFCWNCPVRDECLADALSNHIIWGVWGGTGEKERQRYLGRQARRRVWGGASAAKAAAGR